ncbi:MAG: methyltransferase domain-containing protein [Bacteroidales bacterium]|nr:methyltransferase domain-containing protein [Bacteroidales bacterium]
MDNKNIYEKFDWSALKESDLKNKIQKILEIIPEDVQRILDIGCGNGVITNVLGKAYKVTAVDRSKKALSFVETDKLLASADNIPLPNALFDMVFSSEMLEHLPDGVFEKSVAEMKRLTKKYIFITVPNDENPDKLAIQCPTCHFVFNSPNHLRSFKVADFESLFPDFQLISTLAYGKKVRYYNKRLLQIKKRISPARSWMPYYWMPKEKRKTICPKCELKFEYPYRFNLLATATDLTNVLLSPKKPYWLFVLMEKK